MKLLIILFIGINVASACNEDLTLHKNTDGSIGGFVSKNARISPTAYIDSSSRVCGRVVINGSPRITNGSVISGSAAIDGSPTIQGSRIFENAKISGGNSIVNSVICGTNSIKENVINSTQFCTNIIVKDPGAENNQTLMGIDSNGNGVRDDVEIWIMQDMTGDNLDNRRKALMILAKHIQRGFSFKDNVEHSKTNSQRQRNAEKCYESLVDAQTAERDMGLMKMQVHNTMDRLKAWAKIQGNLSGTSGVAKNENKRSFCEFEVM